MGLPPVQSSGATRARLDRLPNILARTLCGLWRLQRPLTLRLTLSNAFELFEYLQLLDIDLVECRECFVIGFGSHVLCCRNDLLTNQNNRE